MLKTPILIIGMGLSGKAAAHYLLSKGEIVIGIDRQALKMKTEDAEIKELLAKGLELKNDQDLFDLSSLQLVVISPGISPEHLFYQAAKKSNIEIIGEVELACRFLKDKTWIGVTGTNGKTTVTLLIAHILNQCGRPALALGNVGKPLTAQFTQINDEIIVAELSSFQLDTMSTPILSSAVLLNITPDHLDRYSTMEEYAKSKLNIHRYLKMNGKLFVYEQIAFEWDKLTSNIPNLRFGFSSKSSIYIDQDSVIHEGKREAALPHEYKGKKNHDIVNFLAAYAICREMQIPGDQIISAVQSFKKPSHRIEFVESIAEVAYFDDSKGTNIDAVIQAVNYLSQPIQLIAGGVHKGASYRPWLEHFRNKVKEIYAIGEAASLIQKDLSMEIPVQVYPTLEEAVKAASKKAKAGEAVLLSPGCSSYDMFRDYAHRGDEFKRCVSMLSQASRGVMK